MAKGLSIYIGADTKQAVRGIDDIGDGLEKLQDDLGETVKDSATLERKFSDDMRDMSEASDKTGKSLGTDIKAGARKAGDGMNTLKDESRQSLRETAASIKDVSDGLGAVQEIAANALVGFGPGGVAAGLTAAVGIGFVSEALRTAQQTADETKARIGSMYQSAVEDGRAYLDEAQIQAEALRITFDDDQSRYRQAQDDAQRLGLSVQEVIRAQAGDRDALNHVMEIGNGLEDVHLQKLKDSASPMETRALLANAFADRIAAMNDRYTEQKSLLDINQTKADAYLDSTRLSHEEIQKANKALAETPKSVPTVLTVDQSALDAVQNRRLKFKADVTFFGRNGKAVDPV